MDDAVIERPRNLCVDDEGPAFEALEFAIGPRYEVHTVAGGDDRPVLSTGTRH
jgi:hypothetical protein